MEICFPPGNLDLGRSVGIGRAQGRPHITRTEVAQRSPANDLQDWLQQTLIQGPVRSDLPSSPSRSQSSTACRTVHPAGDLTPAPSS